MLRSSLFWQAIAVWASFWVVSPFLEKDTLYDIVTAVAACFAIAVLIAYGPGIIRTVRSADRRSGTVLILGIGCTWTGVLGNRIWGWAFQFMERPEWMQQHKFLSFLIWIVATGGALHLWAFNAIEGRVPPKTWALIGGIIAAGILTSLGLAWGIAHYR